MDWNKLITEAHAENSKGIEMRRGKKYTTVAVRVEILRRNFGGVGISTEIVQWSPDKGAPIVVKATVTDATGRVMSTGYAEEIRGQGQVNSTSALENAETSAIGRALAALGLSGGEFASANEMDGVERKTEAQKAASKPKADPGADNNPPDADPVEISTAIDTINACETADGLAAHWRLLNKNAKHVAADHRVIAAKDSRKLALAGVYPPN
jgi:deoxycytidylate deaminase